jgi:hypothetical protein
MILHARKCTFHPQRHQCWRGLRPFMQLHEKRHMKCAGEAGEVLRAKTDADINYFLQHFSQEDKATSNRGLLGLFS